MPFDFIYRLLFRWIVFVTLCPLTINAQSSDIIQQLEGRLSKQMEKDSLAKLYRQLTRLYVKEHQYHEAIRATQLELKIYKNLDKKDKIGEAYFNLASINRSTANFKMAHFFARNALVNFKDAYGDKHIECASVLKLMAQIYYQEKDYKAALEKALNAKEIYALQNDRNLEADFAINLLLGSVYFEKAAYQEAEDLFLQNLKLYQENKEVLSEELLARVYNNLALIKEQQQAFAQALAYFQKVGAIRERLNHPEHISLGVTYSNIGACYHIDGDFQTSLAYHQRSLNIYEKAYGRRHSLVALELSHIARTLEVTGKLDSARLVLTEALSIYDELFGSKAVVASTAIWQMAKVCRKQKDWNKANFYYYKALQLKEAEVGHKHPELARIYLDIASLSFEKGDAEKAYNITVKAVESNHKKGKLLDELLFLQTMEKQIEYSVNLPLMFQEQAFKLLHEMPQVVQKLQSRLSFVVDFYNLQETLKGVCEQSIRLCFQLYQFNKEAVYMQKAFEIAEFNKAVGVELARLERQINGQPNPILRKLLAKRHELENDIQLAEKKQDSRVVSLYQTQLFEVQQNIEAEQVKEKKKYNHLYYQPVNLRQLQQELNAEQQMLLYFIGDKHGFLFIIENDEVTFVNLDKQFTKVGTDFLLTLHDWKSMQEDYQKAVKQYQEQSHKLFKILLPVKLGKELIIIPDDLLYRIPFETLVTYTTTKDIGFSALAYLHENHSVTYGFSATTFYYQEYTHANRRAGEVLAICPEYKHLSNLPFALEECQNIQTLYSGELLSGTQATEQAIQDRISDFSVLHLAMHGYADTTQMSGSRLYCSDFLSDTSSKGVLSSAEIASWGLQADFVVLSACFSGAGYVQKGEGVLSLARDFMMTGVPSALTSLWEVNDKAGSQIITDFYKQLHTLSKPESLREAKRKYIQSASRMQAHPYFWAGFILVGNTQSLDLAPKPFNLWYIGAGVFVVLILIGTWIKHRNKPSAI